MSTRDPNGERDLPFLAGLVGYAASDVVPFHTPGHKQGRGAYPPLAEALGPAVRLDVSDVLSSAAFNDSWTDALAEAERLAAGTFGARRTYFVVNGTSGAIHAMLLAARMIGYRRISLPRASHLSVFAGLVLSGLEPTYLDGPILPGWNIPLPPTVREHEDAEPGQGSVLFATHPTYYGIAPELRPLSELAEARRGVLLVDEAHGPHYGFHPRLPASALQCGAHVVAQSTHKLLGALTQSSMLHLGASEVPPEVVERALLYTQSTSPSGLLLASLDAARAQMAEAGAELWEHALAMAARARSYITNQLGMAVLTENDLPPGYVFDATRLVIRTADRGLHGVDAARQLRANGVQVEMADPWSVVVLITWGDSPETIDALCGGLRRVLEQGEGRMPLPKGLFTPPRPAARLTPREAALAPVETVPRAKAKGRISAEMVCPYPPGIPVLCPGEEIDDDVLTYLETIRDFAFEVRGASDPTLERLLVLRA